MAGRLKKLSILIPLAVLVGLAAVYFIFPGVVFNLLIAAERSAAGLTRHRADAAGWRIEYLEGGRGETLLLLHGFSADKDNWTRIARYLTPRLRVIAPDLPGFGESSAPDGDYTVGAQVERVKAFVSAVGLTSFHLGGSSMGGNIAGAYAATYPRDVRSLWLIAPGGVATARPSEMYRLLEEGKPNPLVAESADGYDDLLDFVFVKRPFIPGALKKHLVQQAVAHQAMNRKIFQQLVESRYAFTLETLLKGLKVPTLILWGAGDRVLDMSGAKILEELMPRAEAVVMNAVGHLPMIEKPEETAILYLRFLDRLEGGQVR